MPYKRKRKRKSALISKEWSAADGISTLPPKILAQVKKALDTMEVGMPMREQFFDQRLSISSRQRVAYELNRAGMSYNNVATLLGVGISGAFKLVQRSIADDARGVPQDWRFSNFWDDYSKLKIEGQLNAERARTATTEAAQAAFSRNAMFAFDKGMERILKAEELAKQFAGRSKDGDVDPSDRETTLTWVYENMIVPKLAGPAEEADIVEGESE